jgi:hypothetical protein
VTDAPRVALYTAIYGGYDEPKPLPDDLDCHAYLYTDSQDTAAQAAALGWCPRVVRHGIATLNGSPDITAPMLAHKWWKTHPDLACPDVDISLWVDGSMQIVVEGYVASCVDRLGEDDWGCVPHPARGCIYPEASYSGTLVWRYDAAAMKRQADHYRQFHPAGWGLFATGANIRRHTLEVIELSHRWWDECINWSHQDQLSLPVLLRLYQDRVRWNANLPWHEDWVLHEHG